MIKKCVTRKNHDYLNDHISKLYNDFYNVILLDKCLFNKALLNIESTAKFYSEKYNSPYYKNNIMRLKINVFITLMHAPELKHKSIKKIIFNNIYQYSIYNSFIQKINNALNTLSGFNKLKNNTISQSLSNLKELQLQINPKNNEFELNLKKYEDKIIRLIRVIDEDAYLTDKEKKIYIAH